MKFTILWIKSKSEEKNIITEKCLKSELKGFGNKVDVIEYKGPFEDRFVWINKMFDEIDSDYVTLINSGDYYMKGGLSHAIKVMPHNKKIDVFTPVRCRNNKKSSRAAFSSDKNFVYDAILDLNTYYRICPFYMWGTWISKRSYKKHKIDLSLKYNGERDFLLRVLLDSMQIYYLAKSFYNIETPIEGDPSEYAPAYELEWYYEGLTGYWVNLLKELKGKYGEVPVFVQYQAIYSMGRRVSANSDNRNKHLFEKEEVDEYLMSFKPLLELLDDRVILNEYKVPSYAEPIAMRWIYENIKYGDDFKFNVIWDQPDEEDEEDEEENANRIAYLGYGDIKVSSIHGMFSRILLIEYDKGNLEIDGFTNSTLYRFADEIYIKVNEDKYTLSYNERYALHKAFGRSLYKDYSFHVSLPISQYKKAVITMEARIGDLLVPINFNYQSHYTKVSMAFKNSYWCFGKGKSRKMARATRKSIIVKPTNGVHRAFKELVLWWNMLTYNDYQTKRFLMLRMAYFILMPFIKGNKTIWMYMDKIYKAGDSSEYMYKYGLTQPEKIKHYYLVDKHATDYERLVKEGYKPLVRGSWLHRLIFLYADVLFATNSTVCAFNNYGMPNSSYMRDILNFKTVCLQHGLSVQKIAVAQNRLRDNTKLYCCASKYEIENLNKPVYDYDGYGALKLTGIPRYDGLEDRHVKQIMISPTWRMQAAVVVKTNESDQRGYNPLFKQTDYYRIYNSLINDKRLLEAAKEYGYRIKYVLHPIVSAQAEDFDKNEYVDIVPSVGDMSYETMFCESALMVTDFSGIQFDFAYMRKPVVYLHHDDIPQHYDEGSFFYDTMGFGEICHNNNELIDILIDYMKNDCVMKEEYVRRADDFFYYNDHKNCERVYKEVLKL